jgi:hypothetical protein
MAQWRGTTVWEQLPDGRIIKRWYGPDDPQRPPLPPAYAPTTGNKWVWATILGAWVQYKY